MKKKEKEGKRKREKKEEYEKVLRLKILSFKKKCCYSWTMLNIHVNFVLREVISLFVSRFRRLFLWLSVRKGKKRNITRRKRKYRYTNS